MNSQQRRARIRAGMPNVLRRITTMKLIGDMDARDADRYIAVLQSPYLKLRDFEAIVRTVAVAERDVELRGALKAFVTSTTRRTASTAPMLQQLPRCVGASSRAVKTIVFDEVTSFK